MPPKKVNTISVQRKGKAIVMPNSKQSKLPVGTSSTFIPTMRFHDEVSNRTSASSCPNPLVRLPFHQPHLNASFTTMRNRHEDDDEDDDDYDESADGDEETDDSDNDSMACNQLNWDADDILGHEAQVDIIDAFGRHARRGITRLSNIWNLPKGERVAIEVNKNFQVVGENSSLFPRFLGTMVRKGDYCPLNYLTWPKVPKEYKKHCLTTIESKFILRFNNDDAMISKCWSRFALSCLGRRWRDFRKQLKDKFFDISKTKEQMVNSIPSFVDPLQMKYLIDYWLSSEGKVISVKNKTSRSFQKNVHTLGSKTYARLAHELEMMDGRAQTRTDLYIKSRKRKTGEPVTEISAKNIKEMETFISQQEMDPSEGIRGEIVYAEDDIYSRVISKEKRNGRIRGLGFGPMISRTRSSTKSSYCDFVQQHMDAVNIIKTLQEQLLEKECRYEEIMLEKEAERKQFEQKIQDMILQKEKQFEERIKNIEQILPGVHINGVGRDEVSSGMQPRSSCASHHEEDFA